MYVYVEYLDILVSKVDMLLSYKAQKNLFAI